MKTPNHDISRLAQPHFPNIIKPRCKVKRNTEVLLNPGLVEKILDVRLWEERDVGVRDVKRRSLSPSQ
jgi:hypothetical protein